MKSSNSEQKKVLCSLKAFKVFNAQNAIICNHIKKRPLTALNMQIDDGEIQIMRYM